MNSELEYSQTVTTSGGGADVCHAKIEAPSDQNCTLRLRGQVKNSASTSLYPKFFFIICSSGDITSAGTFSASVTLKRRRFGDSVTGRTTLKTCSGNPTVTTGSSAGQKVGERGVEGHAFFEMLVEVPAGKIALVYSNDSNTLPVDLLYSMFE
jgi:hypothetical protein